MFRISASIAALCVFISPNAFAQHTSCARNCQVEHFQDLVQKIMVVNESGRLTEEEYAAKKGIPLTQVQNRFAATGTIECGGRTSSASLTGANGVITTSAHIFINPDNCSKKNEPKSCTFSVKVGSKIQRSKISNLVGMGFNCPNLPNDNDHWAVLQLEKEIIGIKPYGLPDSDLVLKEEDQLVSVSGIAQDFSRIDSKTGKKIYPKTIDECNRKKIFRRSGTPIFYESDCDSSPGTSGGSVLSLSRDGYVLEAITVGSNEDAAMAEKAVKNGTVNSGPYRQGEWAAYHIPLTGKFLETVEKAGGRRL